MLERGYEPICSNSYSYRSQDGDAIIDVKQTARGARDLHAGLMQLSLAIARNPAIRRAFLVVLNHGMSADRITREWRDGQSALRADISDRLGLVAIGRGGLTVIPDTKELADLGESIRRAAGVVGSRSRRPEIHFTILKILVLRWLLGSGPVSSTELGHLAGCSFPTVAKSLRRLEAHLIRHSNRSVELKSFPRAPWDELLAMSNRVRKPVRFFDESGDAPDPAKLLERLNRLRPRQVAVGGVFAARYWDPEFDLHGVPRLDLSVHAKGGNPDLAFISKLDPALRAAPESGHPAVLVVHAVHRAEDLFFTEALAQLPWADPVETLLDLHELRLVRQADELVSRLLKRSRK